MLERGLEHLVFQNVSRIAQTSFLDDENVTIINGFPRFSLYAIINRKQLLTSCKTYDTSNHMDFTIGGDTRPTPLGLEITGLNWGSNLICLGTTPRSLQLPTKQYRVDRWRIYYPFKSVSRISLSAIFQVVAERSTDELTKRIKHRLERREPIIDMWETCRKDVAWQGAEVLYAPNCSHLHWIDYY